MRTAMSTSQLSGARQESKFWARSDLPTREDPDDPGFHRIKDKRFWKIVEEKLWDGKGIKTNIHRIMITATK